MVNQFFFNEFIILGEDTCLNVQMWFKTGQRGCRVLMVDDFSYNRNRQTEDKTYWICSRKVSSNIFILQSDFSYQFSTTLLILYKNKIFFREVPNAEHVLSQKNFLKANVSFINHFYTITIQKLNYCK